MSQPCLPLWHQLLLPWVYNFLKHWLDKQLQYCYLWNSFSCFPIFGILAKIADTLPSSKTKTHRQNAGYMKLLKLSLTPWLIFLLVTMVVNYLDLWGILQFMDWNLKYLLPHSLNFKMMIKWPLPKNSVAWNPTFLCLGFEILYVNFIVNATILSILDDVDDIKIILTFKVTVI